MRFNTQAKLIIGSDSLIGNALMSHLQRSGEKTYGTSRRLDKVKPHCWYLNLYEDTNEWELIYPVSCAVICAGVTSLEECRTNPVATARINVESICALARKLALKGIFVIYLSTNQVFDGSVPFSLPDDPVSPQSEYGRQKAEVERRLKELGDSIAIIRLTKVLGSTNKLLSSWVEDLSNGKAIEPFSDMFISPISLSCVISVLRLVMDRQLSGILQVSGKNDLSYAEIAEFLAGLISADKSLVRPIPVSQSNICVESMLQHTTLNIDRLKSAFGIEPSDTLSIIKEVLTLKNVNCEKVK